MIASDEPDRICVLVVEDDKFQRFGLIDLLSVLNYDYLEASNGETALEILCNENNKIDLVLLDVYMQGMGGLELLQIMKKNPKLQDIPVVMMSADGDREVAAQFLKSGAKIYLEKPIRPQIVKSLHTYVQLNKKSNSLDNNKNKSEYKKLTLLGAGSYGTVYLARRENDGQYFALKILNLSIMSEDQQKLAENECVLLKAMVGPSIIRFYDSFKKNDVLYIVMEYAEGGTLRQKFQEYKQKGLKIEEDQILQWISELVIGVSLIHAKHVLHRDIKTENIFITKSNELKIGDFGVSKQIDTLGLAKTLIGTLYSLSPELVDGKPYGKKSDIWALGCVFYEMIALKRPFEHDTYIGMLNLIKNEKISPLPENINPEIKSLIEEMLQKDPELRPSIFEIVKIPVLKDRIKKIISKSEYFEDVEAFFNIEYLKMMNSPNNSRSFKSTPSQGSSKNDEKQTLQQNAKLSLEKLEDLSNMIRSKFLLKQGLTKQFSGIELFTKISERFSHIDENERMQIGQDLINHQFIHPTSGTYIFRKEADVFYVFNCDKQTIYYNMNKIWFGKTRNPIEVSCDLIKDLNILMKEIIPLGSNVLEIPDNFRKISKTYQKFLDAICEFQKVQIEPKLMNENERLTFFLNLYQVMKTHRIIHKEIAQKESNETKISSKGLFQSLMQYMPTWKKFIDDFIYKIGNFDFTLFEIRDGILRGNKRSKYFKGWLPSDSKFGFILKTKDPRVLCVIGYENIIEKKIEEFQKENVSQMLDNYCNYFLSLHVHYNPVDSEIILPRCFDDFRDDIGQNQLKRLEWILQYVNNINSKEILKKAEENPNIITNSDI